MPIIVKDYTWRQTETTVSISVPLRGAHPSKVDVFTSERYIKLSYNPFFFDVILEREIDTSKSICTFTASHAILELTKIELVKWDNLEANLTKPEKKALKEKCINEEFEKIREGNKDRSNKRHELKRVAVRQAIKQDTNERQLVEKLKNEEKTTALGNLEEWRDDFEEKVEEEIDPETSSEDDEPVVTKKLVATKEPVVDDVNPVRATQTLVVTFTKRELPTPCRESRMEEENEWLASQALARRSVGFNGDDLKPEEKNPLYVKCKGDEFLKQGNYMGAISAYSFGIQLSPKFVDLYLGRLEAQFALGNFSNCAKDCSAALDLMKPEVLANLKQRITCIFKRGISIFKLGFREQGANEVRAAIRLDPSDEAMQAELERMVDIIEDED